MPCLVRVMCLWFVAEVGREPVFGLFHAHAFAFGVVFYLLAVDLADGEVAGLWMSKVDAADGGGGHHGFGFGEPDAGVFFNLHQVPDQIFFGVIG